MCELKLVAAILLCVVAIITADDNNGCGGLLQGEYGRFRYPAGQSKQASSVSSCLWTIQLPYGSDIRFTLDTFSSTTQLILYPEQNPTRRALSSVRLNVTDVGSSVEFKGRTLIIILRDADSHLSFTWESLSENEEKTVVAANYIDTTDGSLEWRQRRPSERLTCAINSGDSTMISWRTTVGSYSCNLEDPCQCFYFGIFQVAPSGSLIEAGRICGQASAEGTFEKSSSQVVTFVYTNMAEHSDLNTVAISWQSHISGTTGTTTSATTTISTSTTTTEVPPDDTVLGILAATTEGLVAISLDTLNATVISPAPAPIAYGVAFDTKTGKAVWSEQGGSIKRAYPNGTDLEVLRTGTGTFYGVAIDALTGNVYYSDYFGDCIMVCNSEVQNCVAVVTAPLVELPIGVTVHFQRRQLYWTQWGMHSIGKANLDGSNATLIITGVINVHSIVVDNDDGRIYWTSNTRNVIESSDLEGGDMRTLVEFLGSPAPAGLVMHRNLLYIGHWVARSIQSVDKYTGGNLTTICSLSGQTREIAIIDTGANQYASDDNPCEGSGCSYLCVTARDSYRCLCPENAYLGSNKMTCSK